MKKGSAKKKSSKQDQLEAHIAELTADVQRIQADYVNYKRRSDEERVQLVDYVKVEVVKQLLPFINNVERAMAHMPKDLEQNDWAKGVQQVAKQLKEMLKSIGVERIEALGQPFDPQLHEAVSMEEGEGEVEVVCEELQPGYKLGDQIIRPAMVRVKREKK